MCITVDIFDAFYFCFNAKKKKKNDLAKTIQVLAGFHFYLSEVDGKSLLLRTCRGRRHVLSYKDIGKSSCNWPGKLPPC